MLENTKANGGWGDQFTAQAIASVHRVDILMLKANGWHPATYSHSAGCDGVIVLAHLGESHYQYTTPFGKLLTSRLTFIFIKKINPIIWGVVPIFRKATRGIMMT